MAKMEEKTAKPQIQRAATTDSSILHESETSKPDAESPANSPARMRKSVSMDSGEAEVVKKSLTSTGSFKRRSIRRRSSKRVKAEPEFGHDTETYEKIRERVLQERAVTNAIDALQERWRMIMFMYDDCVAMNGERRDRKLRKLCVKRQFELIMIVSVFVLMCVPISAAFVLINR